MKRILICSTDYLPHIGGAELAIKHITDNFNPRDFDIHLITARLESRLPRLERIGNVVVHRVGLGFAVDKFLLPIWGFLVFIPLAFEGRFERVWAMMASHGSVLASIISFLFRIPLTLTLQEGDEEVHLERYVFGNTYMYKIFIQPWHTLAFKRAEKVTVISSYLKERAKKYSSAPITIIPNGVDLDQFRVQKDDARVVDIQKKYNLENKKVIISVSRLVYKNNIEILIKALQMLPREYVLLLVGDGNKRADLEILAKELAVVDRVIFVGRILPEYIPFYLAAGDVFARVSRSEGFGSAFLESFAARVPVVASPVGGIVDFVEHEKTGLLVSPDNTDHVAHTLLRILTDHELRTRIITNAYEAVREYSWRSISQKMADML